MIYRKLDSNGDCVFGMQSGNFYQDQPEAVAQAVKTRLGLATGEWVLDVNEGTPYSTEILGMGTVTQFDRAIQERIINTEGVVEIVDYASYVDPSTRATSVSCILNTKYGQTTLTHSF